MSAVQLLLAGRKQRRSVSATLHRKPDMQSAVASQKPLNPDLGAHLLCTQTSAVPHCPFSEQLAPCSPTHCPDTQDASSAQSSSSKKSHLTFCVVHWLCTQVP